jgi:hypothetical protein
MWGFFEREKEYFSIGHVVIAWCGSSGYDFLEVFWWIGELRQEAPVRGRFCWVGDGVE